MIQLVLPETVELKQAVGSVVLQSTGHARRLYVELWAAVGGKLQRGQSQGVQLSDK